ncbi:MAG: phage tail tape measure protein, partial [Bacteroidales bacterium]
MAGFNLVAQLQLRAPTNTKEIVNRVKGSLRSISVDISLNISQSAEKNLTAIQHKAIALASTLRDLKAISSDVAVSLSRITSGGIASDGLSKALNTNTSSINNAALAVKNLKNNIVQAKDSVEEFGRAGGLAGRRFVGFTIVSGTILTLTTAIKEGITQAILYEREFIKLKQVGATTSRELSKLNSTISDLSRSYGVSSKELLSSAVVLRQAGIAVDDVERAMSVLAKTTLAPSFDDLKKTTEGVVAIMAQFKVETKEIEKSLGAVNAVSNAYAVEARDIIEAVKRAGGAFKASGGDLEEFIALFTSVRSTTRESAEAIATGLRTIFARLQRSDTVTALQQLGINLRYTRQEAKILANASLEDQFVGAYEAVRRLSNALKNIPSSDPRFSQIVEQLGGYRQISRVIPLLLEFKTAQEALNVARYGSISIDDAANKAQDSTLVRIQKLKEQFLDLFRTILGNRSIQNFIDTLIRLSNAFLRVAEVLSPLVPLLTTFATIKIATNIVPFLMGVGKGSGFTVGQKMNRGGVVRGYGDRDNVPAILTPGEFVLNKKIVEKIGTQKLHELNSSGKISKFADGGLVTNRKEISARTGSVRVGSANIPDSLAKFLYGLSSKTPDEQKILLDSANRAGAQNQQLLKKYLGNRGGDYKNISDIFVAMGLDESSARSFKVATNAAREFIDKRKKLIDTGGDSKSTLAGKSRTLVIPLYGDTMGMITLPKGGDVGKVGRDSLNAGLRVSEWTVDSMGFNPRIVSILKNANVHKLLSGVNVHVLRSFPSQDFHNEIIGNINNHINGLFAQKFGKISRPLEKTALDKIVGPIYEKYIEGLSGIPTQNTGTSEAFFEYTKSKVGSTLGKSFDKFIFPSPLTSKYVDIKASFSRQNLKSISQKYINQLNQEKRLQNSLIRFGNDDRRIDKGIKFFNSGGLVPGVGNRDTVPAALTPGEFVIRKSSVKKIGVENLQKLNQGGSVQPQQSPPSSPNPAPSSGTPIPSSSATSPSKKSSTRNVIDYYFLSKKPLGYIVSDIKSINLPSQVIGFYRTFKTDQIIPSSIQSSSTSSQSPQPILQQKNAVSSLNNIGEYNARKLVQEILNNKNITTPNDLVNAANKLYSNKFSSSFKIKTSDVVGQQTPSGYVFDKEKTILQIAGKLNKASNVGHLKSKFSTKSQDAKNLESQFIQGTHPPKVNLVLPTVFFKPKNAIGSNFDKYYKEYVTKLGRDIVGSSNSRLINTSQIQVTNAIAGTAFEDAIRSTIKQAAITNNQNMDFYDVGFLKSKYFTSSAGTNVAAADAKINTEPRQLQSFFNKGMVFWGLSKIKKTSNIPANMNLLGLNKGGMIPNANSSKDTVPALLTPGEYVISKNKASQIGEKNLRYMNETGKIPQFHSGGPVGHITSFSDGGPVDKKITTMGKLAEVLGGGGKISAGGQIFNNEQLKAQAIKLIEKLIQMGVAVKLTKESLEKLAASLTIKAKIIEQDGNKNLQISAPNIRQEVLNQKKIQDSSLKSSEVPKHKKISNLGKLQRALNDGSNISYGKHTIDNDDLRKQINLINQELKQMAKNLNLTEQGLKELSSSLKITAKIVDEGGKKKVLISAPQMAEQALAIQSKEQKMAANLPTAQDVIGSNVNKQLHMKLQRLSAAYEKGEISYQTLQKAQEQMSNQLKKAIIPIIGSTREEIEIEKIKRQLIKTEMIYLNQLYKHISADERLAIAKANAEAAILNNMRLQQTSAGLAIYRDPSNQNS